MKTTFFSKVSFFAAVSCCFIGLTSLQAQDISGNTVVDDLDVTGSAAGEGTITLGSLSTDTSQFGLWIGFADESGTASTILFLSNRANNTWQWSQNGLETSGTGALQMQLSGSDNSLSLYTTTSGSAVIVLSPNAGTITVNGQALLTQSTAASTYLTQSVASSGYVQKTSDGGVVLGDSTIGNPASFALGPTSFAGDSIYGANSPYPSFSAGSSTQANGHNSIAMGDTATANGSQSVAMGYSTTTNGEKSFAAGTLSETDGFGAIAVGGYNEALGDFSGAFGLNSYAQGQTQFVIGQFNAAQGTDPNQFQSDNHYHSYTPPSATDPLFIIGNGQPEYTDEDGNDVAQANSNALTVDWSGNVNAAGAFRCSPAGDLSMGTYTSGTDPQTVLGNNSSGQSMESSQTRGANGRASISNGHSQTTLTGTGT